STTLFRSCPASAASCTPNLTVSADGATGTAQETPHDPGYLFCVVVLPASCSGQHDSDPARQSAVPQAVQRAHGLWQNLPRQACLWLAQNLARFYRRHHHGHAGAVAATMASWRVRLGG